MGLSAAEKNREIAQFCPNFNRLIVKLEQASPPTLAEAFLLWGREEATLLQLLKIDQKWLENYFDALPNTPKEDTLLINKA